MVTSCTAAFQEGRDEGEEKEGKEVNTLWRHREGVRRSLRVARSVVAAATRSAVVRRGAIAEFHTSRGRTARLRGGEVVGAEGKDMAERGVVMRMRRRIRAEVDTVRSDKAEQRGMDEGDTSWWADEANRLALSEIVRHQSSSILQ